MVFGDRENSLKAGKQISLPIACFSSGNMLNCRQIKEVFTDMDMFMQQALEVAKAQASIRPMTAEQMSEYIKTLADMFRSTGSDEAQTGPEAIPVEDPAKSIRERTITCLECGRSFKMLTKRHLATHGLDAKSYREKYGMKKGTPLTCKALHKAKKAKMAEMRLWERIGRNKATN